MNVLIMGGSSDIGINLGKYLLTKGNKVIIGYNKHYEEIKDIEFVKCDVRNEKSIDKTIRYVIDKYGSLEMIINMAAISLDNSFLNKTKQEFMDVIETNLVGTFLCCQSYSRYVDNGIIVNVSSTDGIDTYSEYSMDYSASKAGIINMSKNISNCTKNKVICICPNWCDSNSTRGMNQEYLDEELRRIGQNRLITLDELNYAFDKIINNSLSGDVFRIDIKGDKLWIEKM